MKGRLSWRLAVLGLFLLFMAVPVIATAMFSVAVRWDRTIWPEGFTLAWWVKVTGRTAFRTTLMNAFTLEPVRGSQTYIDLFLASLLPLLRAARDATAA